MKTNLWVLLSAILPLFCSNLAAKSAPQPPTEKQDARLFVAVATCPIRSPANLDGYVKLDPQSLLDLPDPATVRATSTFEAGFVDKLVRGEILGPLSKSYCQIGITRMVIDITYPVADDAISHITQRAIYQWTATATPVGWQITALGEKQFCARTTNPKTGQCL